MILGMSTPFDFRAVVCAYEELDTKVHHLASNLFVDAWVVLSSFKAQRKCFGKNLWIQAQSCAVL
jgi:hypothetical protein